MFTTDLFIDSFDNTQHGEVKSLNKKILLQENKQRDDEDEILRQLCILPVDAKSFALMLCNYSWDKRQIIASMGNTEKMSESLSLWIFINVKYWQTD